MAELAAKKGGKKGEVIKMPRFGRIRSNLKVCQSLSSQQLSSKLFDITLDGYSWLTKRWQI